MAPGKADSCLGVAAASAIPRTRAVRRSLTLLRIFLEFGRLRHTVPLIRHHHERWDGRGYPEGLAADAIPLGAAIVGLADAWDAMTTDRPYHRALDPAEAEDELRTHRGSQFSPAVVDAFFRVLERSRPPEGSRTRPPTRARVAASA